MKNIDIGRGAKHFTRVGNEYGREPLLLGRVLFPHRYDIVAQEKFLRVFYQERQGDPAKVEAIPENYPSYMWDRMEIVQRLRQKWGFLIVHSEAKFARRVNKYVTSNIGKLVAIWESVRIEGYRGSGKGKLHFKKIVDGGVTLEGHKLPGKDALYLTNGQHRCTVLLAIGQTTIRSDWYTLTLVKDFKPIETTHEYIKRGLLSEAEFVQFARLRFPKIPKGIVTIKKFREWAHGTKQPAWLLYYLGLYWGKT